jgi:hypothetical protein
LSMQMGYYRGEVDGSLGPLTREAAHSLPDRSRTHGDGGD